MVGIFRFGHMSTGVGRIWIGRRLLEGGGAFDPAVGVGEEVQDDRVELVFFEDRGGVAGIGDDPEVGLADVRGYEDGMGNGDGVVVAADDEGRAGDLVELGQGDIGLVIVKI